MKKSKERNLLIGMGCLFSVLFLAATNVSAQEFSFADLANREFLFASGVGGWGTYLYVHEDGSFEGTFHDSEMGETGEGYPNGSVYVSEFSGTFEEPWQMNDYTYVTRIASIQTEKEPYTEKIWDGLRYVYSTPYGMESDGDFLIYLPEAPVSALPEGYLSWVRMALPQNSGNELSFYGLYNQDAALGFSSSVIKDRENPEPAPSEMADLDATLADLDERANAINSQLNSGSLNQNDLNRLSQELYWLWDDELNELWRVLQSVLPADQMDALTDEEVAWIERKEARIEEVSSSVRGGSMEPMVRFTTAARLTRERVYVLADYLR